MLILIAISAVIGLIVSAWSGISLIGWLVGGFFFVCGLPGALISAFVDDRIDYVQEREDDRWLMRELDEDIRADEHEYRADKRANRIAKGKKGSVTQIYNDHRQVHINGRIK